MDVAEAVNRLYELAEVWERAQRRGLTNAEIVEEFKRVRKEKAVVSWPESINGKPL